MNSGFVPRSYRIPDDDIKLLASCVVNTYRAQGKGGQHVNKTDSAVRIRHAESGIVVTCQRERSQYLNKMHCVRKLRCKLEALCEVPAERIPTRISVKERKKRLELKSHQSVKKRLRKKPDISDDR